MQAVRQIAKKPSEQLTQEERAVLVRFHASGCTRCHWIKGGDVELTEEGKRLSQVHLGCPEIMRALSR